MKAKQATPPKSKSPGRKTNGRAGNSSAASTAKRWQERCSQLENECDQLRLEVAQVEAQRDGFSQLLCEFALGDENSDFDLEDLLALLNQVNKGQSMQDLIAEIAQTG